MSKKTKENSAQLEEKDDINMCNWTRLVQEPAKKKARKTPGGNFENTIDN